MDKSIGNRIRLLREKKNETQAQLAKALNVKRETVNQWENGARDLKTEYTVALANRFETTCDYIIRGKNLFSNCEICTHESENKRLKEWFGIFKTLNECNIKLIDENDLTHKKEAQ